MSVPRQRRRLDHVGLVVALTIVAGSIATRVVLDRVATSIPPTFDPAASAPEPPSGPATIPAPSSMQTTSVIPGRASRIAATNPIVAAARAQVGVTTGYDPAYVSLRYPGGDVSLTTGVCTDVVIRSLRAVGIDLQQRIHEDMRASFARYPQKWGLTKPDANIDHRRVPNIATYFARQGFGMKDSRFDLEPGDIVTFKVPLDHIGIVSDIEVDGRPLIIHNIGAGTREDDALASWEPVAHFRVRFS